MASANGTPVSRWFVALADDARLNLLEWPSAPERPLLLLLHGGGAHAHWWDHVAPVLATTHRVVALDFRGHGDSEHTPGRYGLDRLVADAEALIDHLGGRAAVVGALMGGQVAMRAASRSCRIRRLSIVDVPRGAPPEVLAHGDRLRTPKRHALADTVKFRVSGFFQQLAALSGGEGARSVIVSGS